MDDLQDDIPDFNNPSPKHLVRAEAEKQGVDPDLAERVMNQESGGRFNARSPKGAYGPMQLMPGTARQLGVNSRDPYQNIRGGVTYLKQQVDRFGSPKLAAAAYNAGPGAVQRAGNRVPKFKETQGYVKATAGDDIPDFSDDGLPDFSVSKQAVVNTPKKAPFAWNAGSTPIASPPRPVYQLAKLAAQADSSGDAPHIAESYNPTPPPPLGRNFTETVSPPQRVRSRPFSIDAQARGANVGVRPRVLPGDDTELVPAGSVFHPTSIADIEAQGRAINRGYRNQAMEQEGANTDARHGAVVNTLRHLGSNVLAGAGETTSGIVGGVARLLPGQAAANVVQTAKELQETASDVRARQGQGVANDLAYEAGALAPQMVSGGPVGFGVTSALNAAGHGATLPESIKQGVSAAATAKLGGVLANRLQRPLARAPEAYMERAAGNVMAPVIARAATGGGLDVTPSDIIFGGAFGLHGGSEQSARREAAEGKAPTKTYPAQYGSARERYEASRAAQEREPVALPVIVKPTEASTESALQSGIGARQPLQSPRLVKRAGGTQDIKQAASPVEDVRGGKAPVFHSETGPVGHDEMVSTLDDLLSLIPERATRQRIIDESVAEGGASYENVVRAAFRKAEEATSGKGGDGTPEPPSDAGMEGADVSRGTQQEPPQLVSYPSPARGLTRNFRAGNNDASMTFADDTHRDLYDLGAKMRYLGRGGQNKPNQRAVGDIAGLRKSLAERLNIPQADIGRMAMDTLDDVKAQMKGVKHGEGRQLANNVQAPTPTVTTVKNRAPQNRAVNPESDSLLAAIQKIGFDSTTQEGADLARYLSTREGGRPGMVNNQRLNDGERRGVDNHLIRSLQEAGFDIKDSNDLMNKVRQEQGGKPVYSTAYNHAAQAARELKPYLEANHSPEIAQTVNTLAEAINNHSEFGQLSDKIAHGEATDAEIKRFGEVGRYELNIDPDAIQSFIETHENAQQSQGRGAQPGVEARESQISGAERKAGEREGDVNDTQRVATQKSGNREFPALSDSGDVREYSVGRGRTETLLPENSGGLRRTTPARADYIHDTLDRLTEQARATKRSLTELVDEHIAQTPLPGQESTAFTPEEASMARSLAANYDTARSTRRAPVKEQTQSLLDTTPTTESRQTAQEQAESQQGEGLANSPLFEGKPDWVNQNLNVLTQGAEKSGLADRIEASAMQRKTAKETARELGTDVDTVRAVRAKRGIPSMEDVTEFEKWLADRQPTHHSELQPRTPEGRFDGPPTTPEYVKPSSVETVHQSELQGALQLKADAWKKVKELRTRIANEPLGGNRSGLRLQLMNWQDAYGKAIELERQARQAIESRANELKQTTVKPKPAPDFTLKEPKTEPAKGEHGHFINALFKSPDADNQVPSFLANPEVRARLGLPRTGKPAETKDALAEAMGLPRSSHISPEALRAWASENGLGQDALSAIDSAHAQYRAKLRAKELGGRDDDPDIITRYRNDLGKKSGDLSGTLLSDPERGYKAVTVLGYDLYQTAKDFGNWSRQMVGKFGERIRPMLRDLWNGIKNSDFVKDERGFVRVDTPEFKRWFGKSKVVDEKGEALPLYHGTNRDFSEFSKKDAGKASPHDPGLIGPALYFTTTGEDASQFAFSSQFRDVQTGKATEEVGANVVPVYVSIKNPYYIHDGILEDGRSFSQIYPRGLEPQAGRSLQRRIKSLGRDGVILTLNGQIEQVVAFDPKQIKSATGNSGAFNPDSASLTDPPFVDKVKSKLLDLFPGERPPLPPGFKGSEGGFLRFGGRKATPSEAKLFDDVNKLEPEEGKAKSITDFIIKARRAMLLSSVKTIGKLGAAATGRIGITPIEEGIGGVLSKVPGISRIAAKAPREGGLSLAAERSAISNAFSKQTLRDMKQTAKTGASSLDIQYGGKDVDTSPEAIEFFGRLHGAMKAPAKRAEFYRALEKRTAFAVREAQAKGVDDAQEYVQRPDVQAAIGAKAYEDAQRAIFMSDNGMTEAYKTLRQLAESKGALGKATSNVMRFLLPVVKVPTNYVIESSSYGIGAAKALGQVISAKGIENLTPDQADYVMRNLKKQTIGAAMIAIGYFGAASVGGYFQEGEKRAKGEPEAGGLQVFGMNIPKFLLHTPALEALQIGATLRRVADKQESLKAGIVAAGKGLVEEIPFFNEPARLVKAAKDSTSAAKFAGETVRSMLVPPDVQTIAKMTDKQDGKEMRRYPEGFADTVKVGIPGLRQQVRGAVPEEHSQAENLAAEKRKATMGEMPEMTPEKRERYELKKQITDLAKKGDMDGAVKAFAEGLKSGKLAEDDAKDIDERTKLDYLQYQVKKLSAQDALSIYLDKRTTPEEREKIAEIIEDKLNKYDTRKHPQSDIDALMPQVMEFVKSRPYAKAAR